VVVPKGLRVRRLHKAFLRYHDANNWPLLREALRRMGRADLIGPRRDQLIPSWQPRGTGLAGASPARASRAQRQPLRTQHTGLPRTPRVPPPRTPPARASRPGSAGRPRRGRP
jgi:hypothetical protein